MNVLASLSAMALISVATLTAAGAEPIELPRQLDCTALQTAGFHDFPHNEEAYEPVAFFESRFTLRINRALMRHLAPDADADVYMTLENGERVVELTCFEVRGSGGQQGLSCSNVPPSEFLLINTESLRFTHTSIGGWTFTGATENVAGDSIYVEYGECRPAA